MSSTHSDEFLPLLTFSGCVIPYRELHHVHGWHVTATFDFQLVRIPISWAEPSRLTCFWHFWLTGSAYLYFMSSKIMADMFSPPLSTLRQCVIQVIPISFATLSRLTCSLHSRLSEGAYLYFMSTTLVADMFLPLLTLSRCAFPFRELDWTIMAYMFLPSWLSGSAYLCCMRSTIITLTCSRHFDF